MSPDPIWIVLAVLALLGLLPNAASIAQGVRLRGQVRRASRTALGAFLPPCVVILPVRGLDEGFDENVRAILSQSYPSYRLLVVTDDLEDPAAIRIREIAAGFPRIRVDLVASEPNELRGKVNALRSALAYLSADDAVVVFADSDIRPARDWLRQLVQPLADSSVGVATGFRWYVPPRPTFWSLVRAEWNGVSANVLFDPRRSFAWGGSCAVRQDRLEALRLRERWRGVLSDDLVLTQAVREAGLQIAYVPTALVATFEGATRVTCLEWCERQITMATLYLPIVRRFAVAAFAVFLGLIAFGAVSFVLAAMWGPPYLVPAILFLSPLPAGIAKASLRRGALFSAAPEIVAAWSVPGWRSALAALAVPWVMAWGLVRTRHPDTVRWRGREYDVRDPHRVRLVTAGERAASEGRQQTGL
ncbi:MAG TPA: glycosyltransferase family 2 protein [Thermoplasmata archaeon]|nr:glycosyltransferase family 2 protein [Thermoplasmata archaeon]